LTLQRTRGGSGPAERQLPIPFGWIRDAGVSHSARNRPGRAPRVPGWRVLPASHHCRPSRDRSHQRVIGSRIFGRRSSAVRELSRLLTTSASRRS
jgi:hypothetical protein